MNDDLRKDVIAWMSTRQPRLSPGKSFLPSAALITVAGSAVSKSPAAEDLRRGPERPAELPSSHCSG
ncbi:hypothetical protein SKAU_G00394040 [Synaphobranchus kaupii]|uniref:Uncharacterized protein n=1 Tax=Synaphobranchus kaupii TaxID=118154 RepID=A0A9Q1IDX2_SYNKA|nr:hypothetical protein SKAU_G00394040 [Synaphobranchus kaupii]